MRNWKMRDWKDNVDVPSRYDNAMTLCTCHALLRQSRRTQRHQHSTPAKLQCNQAKVTGLGQPHVCLRLHQTSSTPQLLTVEYSYVGPALPYAEDDLFKILKSIQRLGPAMSATKTLEDFVRRAFDTVHASAFNSIHANQGVVETAIWNFWETRKIMR